MCLVVLRVTYSMYVPLLSKYDGNYTRLVWISRLLSGEHRPTDQPQTCRTCGELLRADFFLRQPSNKTGRRYTCIACCRQKRQAYLEDHRPAVTPSQQTCTMCQQTQPASAFTTYNDRVSRLSTRCKDCQKEARRLR